jgi:glycosyltransferase involved in cell wall biosynthesis
VWISGYATPASWLARISAALVGAKTVYQGDSSILNERNKRRGLLFRALVPRYLRSFHRCLAIGDLNWQANVALGVKPERLSFFPYPVDVQRISRRVKDARASGVDLAIRERLGIPTDAVVAIICGKLIPRKRIHDFCAAITQSSNSRLHGIVVGAGELERTYREQGLFTGRVHSVGFVNQQELPDYLSSADIGVACSDYDPHPLVCTEMAAAGLPLIVSNQCGVYGPNDVLAEGENGCTYPVGDVGALRRVLDSVAGDSVARARMSAASRARAATQDATAAVDVFADIVASL